MRYLILIFALYLLNSCGKRAIQEPDNAAMAQYPYFPLAIGRTLSYQVDSIVYDFGSAGSTIKDSSTTYFKQVFVDTIRDNTGDLVYLVEHYERSLPDADWVLKSINTAQRNDQQGIWTENNLRFLRLVFPLDKRSEWNGNIWIDVNREIEIAGERMRPFFNWNYEVDSIDVPAVVGAFAFDSTLLVTEADDINIIERRFSRVRYAKNVGLVWREQWILDSQYCNKTPPPADCETKPWEQKAEKGYILRQKILSFN